MPIDPRETKLPRWARDELSNLRRLVERAEYRADQACVGSGPDDSDVVIDPYDDVPLRLGVGTRVRFLLKGRDPLRSWVDVRPTGRGTVEVMAGDSIFITPQASNVTIVGVRD